MLIRPIMLALLVILLAVSSADAQETRASVRIAAPSDCLSNIGCGAGLKRFYGVDVASVLVPLTSADAGVAALDDGLAEVAISFTSSPEVSRPDLLALHDDRGMIGSDHIVPVVRDAALRRIGARGRRALDAMSAALSTRALRALNQQLADGRLPEPVGAGFADEVGLGAPVGPRRGRGVTVGFTTISENRVLAEMYAEALRGAGLRVRVVPVGGLRPRAVARLRAGRIDLFPGYARSLVGYLRGRPVTDRNPLPRLRRALRALHAAPLRPAPATNENVFVMKRETAGRLGVTRLSDLSRYWPPSR